MKSLQAKLSRWVLAGMVLALVFPCVPAAPTPMTPDSDNSFDAANPLTSGVAASGSVNSFDDQSDYYVLAGVKAGQAIRGSVTYASSADIRLNIYNSAGTSMLLMGEVSGGSTTRGDTGLATRDDSYYVRVRANSGSSNYALTVTVADPVELVPGTIYSGSLNTNNDSRTEYYRIWLQGNDGSGKCDGAWVNMSKSNPSANIGRNLYDLLNGNGTHAFNESFSTSSRTNLSAAAAYTGWYYYRLYIRSSFSDYSVECGKFRTDCDADNDIGNATMAPHNAHLSGTVDKAWDHYDWYAYGARGGDSLAVNVSRTTSNVAYNVSIFDSNRRYLFGGTSSQWWSYLNLQVPVPPRDETYFVAVIIQGTSYGDDNNARMGYWINFTSTNHPPFAKESLARLTVNEDEGARLQGGELFFDPDGDGLALQLAGARNITGSFNASSGQLELRGVPNWFGVETVTVLAQDTGGLQASVQLEVTVLSVEDAPHIKKSLPELSVNQGGQNSLELSQYFADNDTPFGDALAYGAFDTGFLSVSLSPSGKVVLAAPIDRWGVIDITFIATDATGRAVQGPCRVRVVHVNQAPVVRVLPPDLEVFEDESVVVDMTATFWDPDGDRLSLTATSTSRLAAITKVFSPNVTFKPAPEQAGFTETVKVTASDEWGAGEASIMVRVTVLPVNDPPRITSFTPAGDVSIKETDAASFSVNATDPESAAAVNFTWFLDGKAVLSGSSRFTLRTDHDFAGNHAVRVIVDDGESAADRTWRVAVKNVDREPQNVSILSPAKGQTFRPGVRMDFLAGAEDPDGDPLTYRWMEGPTELGTGREMAISLPLGTHKVHVEVSDGVYSVRSAQVTVNVRSNTQPAILAVYPPDGARFREHERIQFSADAVDSDGDVLEYTWSEGSRVLWKGLVFNTSDLPVGKHSIVLMVSDGTAAQTASVTVQVVERPEEAAGMDTSLPGAALIAVAGAVLAWALVSRRPRKGT